MKEHSTYIKYLFSITLILILPAIALSIHYEPLSGDLTRLGYLSENNYGWNKKQPVQIIFPNPTSKFPEILVIGDSFSYGNVWQSHIKEKYQKNFLTIRWSDLKNQSSCYFEYLKKSYPSLKSVIFETVEMGAVGKLIETSEMIQKPCKFKPSKPFIKQPKKFKTENLRNKNGFIKDPVFLYKTFLNQFKIEEEIKTSSKTYILKLKNKDLFSHVNSEYGLFYRNAINDKKAWKIIDINRAIDASELIKDHLKNHNLESLFLLVPDKSTAYQEQIISKDIIYKNQILDRLKYDKSFISVIDEFKKLVANEIDFYLSNDTHLSTLGYKHMGEIIFNKSLISEN